MKKNYAAVVTLYEKKGRYVAKIDMKKSTGAGSCSQRINPYPSLPRPVDVPLLKSVNGLVVLDFPNAHYADGGKESFERDYELRDNQRKLLEQFVRNQELQDYLSGAINRCFGLEGLPKKIRFEADDGLPFVSCREDGMRAKISSCRGPSISQFSR